MARPVVTFPQPPPTSNTLTSHQRQQLLRSTRKLTKLLGSAPHLIDHDNSVPAVYLDLSSELQFVSSSPSPSHRSYDIPRPSSPASSISSVSTTASKINYNTRSPSRSEIHIPQDAPDSPSTKKRPPMLRLTSPDRERPQSIWSRTKLDTVPGSPPAARDIDCSESSPVFDALCEDSTDHLLTPLASPVTPSLSRSYTLPVPGRGPVPSLFIDTSEPTFKVTSEAATRRLKMERIRKRLGECVPAEAVFPHDPGDDENEDGDYVEVITEKKPAQVNVDVRPRWKTSSAVVAFDVVYECPANHGDEGLANGLSSAPRTSKSRIPTSLRSSNTSLPRRWEKLVKRRRGGLRF